MPIPTDKNKKNLSGIGLRSKHYREVLTSLPPVSWWEVHSENFFSRGGLSLHVLEQIRASYPVSFHGVGLSLGSASGLDMRHLASLKQLAGRFDPMLVSEHISWSAAGSLVANDLLPMPYTEESLRVTISHIQQVQETLGRQVLVENPSTYLEFTASTIPEWEFMAEVSSRSGCGILLDINNIYVSSVNHGYDASRYIRSIPASAVGEIHLAGHASLQIENHTILLDDHGSAVPTPVWQLYKEALNHVGNLPTLIEWDTNIPPLPVLMEEAAKAQNIMEERHEPAH